MILLPLSPLIIGLLFDKFSAFRIKLWTLICFWVSKEPPFVKSQEHLILKLHLKMYFFLRFYYISNSKVTEKFKMWLHLCGWTK